MGATLTEHFLIPVLRDLESHLLLYDLVILRGLMAQSCCDDEIDDRQGWGG